MPVRRRHRRPDYLSATDLFCGAGGSSRGLEAAGFMLALGINHWKRALDTHAENFPNAAHDLCDLRSSQAHPSRWGSTHVLIASPECFPAGTLIVTARGQTPIEEVQVGDLVLTHKGRWRPVTETLARNADTVAIRGQGHYGLETTASHPFWARQASQVWNNDIRNYQRHLAEPDWRDAADLDGHFWATPTTAESLPIPEIGRRGFDLSEHEFWWLVGRWLGDGSVRLRLRSSEVSICCGKHEAEELSDRLAYWRPVDAGRAGFGELRWRQREIRTAVLFETGHEELAQWLVEHFGRHAHGKTIPGWALTMDRECRGSLLAGYMSADGHVNRTEDQVSTVSKQLAIGIRLLAESLGHRVRLYRYQRSREGSIEGRYVSIKPEYVLSWVRDLQRVQCYQDDRHAWSRVKDIVPLRRGVHVYNLEVEEDESYVADGIVVHNCPRFSQARGRRRDQLRGQMHMWEPLPAEAEERSRATMWNVPEFAEEHGYDVILVENVEEVMEWNQIPAWYHALDCAGYRWRTLHLNSMCFGVPQSRDRWYTVAWKKRMRTPDLEFTPDCWCPWCEKTVEGRQAWKRPDLTWGRYGRNGQYVYLCPVCQRECAPWVAPAASAIDWTIPSQRIGDRKTPLKPNTMARLRVGVDRHWLPFLFDLQRAAKDRTVAEPMFTETTRQGIGLALPPVMIHERGTSPSHMAGSSRLVHDPMGTITASGLHHGLLQGPDGPELALYVKNYGDAEAAGPMSHSVWDALGTITGQDHHGLVRLPLVSALRSASRTLSPAQIVQAIVAAAGAMEPPPLIAPLNGNRHGSGGERVRSVVEPFTTQTADLYRALVTSYYSRNDATRPSGLPLAAFTGEPRHGLLDLPDDEWAMLASYYGTAVPHDVAEPMGALTSRDRHALVQGRGGDLIDLNLARFRMLQPHEHQKGMGFPDDYVIGGNQREKVRQCGQAVTPPLMEALGQRIYEVLNVAA